MSSVGFKVHDLALMTEFYQRVLGYAVTGQGVMPALGEEPRGSTCTSAGTRTSTTR